MKKRKIYFLAALAVTSGILSLLISGSSLLTIALDNEGTIPLGTFITWAGMISLPLTIYWGIKEMRTPTKKTNVVLAGFLTILIALGILWVPIAYLLAGNISFTFSEKETFQGGQAAMRWFWRLTYGIGIGAILTIVIYWISLLIKKDKPVAQNGHK